MDLDTFRTEGTTISPVVRSITHIREKSMLNFTVWVKRLLPWNEGSHFEDGVREQIKRRRLSLTTHAGKQTTVERP